MQFVTPDLRDGQDVLIGKCEWPTELLLNSGKLEKFQVAKLINLFTTRYVLAICGLFIDCETFLTSASAGGSSRAMSTREQLTVPNLRLLYPKEENGGCHD